MEELIIKKLFLVLGRTASGKTTIVKEVAEQLNLSVVKSYATRPMRDGETVENSDHIHIKDADVERFKDDIAAYTEINGYKYFGTKEQMKTNDFYVIDPAGYNTLKGNEQNFNIELITIYITVPFIVRQGRASGRGDSKEAIKAREDGENEQFSVFEKGQIADYYILNDGDTSIAIERMKQVVRKELGK